MGMAEVEAIVIHALSRLDVQLQAGRISPQLAQARRACG